jgi:cell division transport system permease protein
MRLRLVVSEAIRSLRASMSTTMAATVTVLIGMFVLGLAIALGSWVLSWSDHVKKQLEVKVYFQPTATGKQIDNVRLLLAENPQVKSYSFVSKAEALAEMRKKVPDIVKNLAYNPLPASYEVIPKKAEYISSISRALEHPVPAGVDRVKNGGETSKRVLKVGKYVELIFLVAVIVLLIASTLLIANTIRLSIFARRREIEVMKLVGATNWFVRGPFMLEGLICGLVGSLAAVLLLVLGDSVALPALSIGHSKNAHAIALELNSLIIVGTGLLLGAAGSGLTLRRFLRV